MKSPWRTPIMVLVLLAGTVPLSGHETDQYTLPPNREFADLGDYFTRWFYQRIEAGVENTNWRIRQAVEGQASQEELDRLQSPDTIATAVNREFPWAMDVIEGLERMVSSREMKLRYPGRVIGYKEGLGNIYQGAHFPLDPRQFFRLFLGSTMKVHGVFLGTDKIGHFTDMGMNYYREYRSALRAGKSEEESLKLAIKTGTHGLIFSERGMLGFMSAGSYSNADLAANYLGMLFYQNLTEPVMLKGQKRPAMLIRQGPYWKIADHVRRDSDFFKWFISEHMDEALNPSLYETLMRGAIRRNIEKRAAFTVQHRRDVNGQIPSREYFDRKAADHRTYWGVDYGHMGEQEQLITITNTCLPALENPARTDDRDEAGRLQLYAAAQFGQRGQAASLLSQGVEPTAAAFWGGPDPSLWGNTPLHIAAAESDVQIVRAMLGSKGADASAQNFLGATPLHRGIHSAEVTEALLDRGAKADGRDVEGRTPLHWAARDTGSKSIASLLERGANPNATDHRKQTPLHLAAVAGNAPAAAELIRHGSQVAAMDEHKTTPLHLAAANEKPDGIRLLLSNRASVSARDDFGYTPLHEAARKGGDDGAVLLIAAGADVKAIDRHGTTPLHLACRHGRRGIARILMEKGADVNAANAAGCTPLHEAATSGDKVLVQMLLDAGAKSTANLAGWMPVDMAAARHDDAIAHMLGGSSQTITD